RAAMECPQRSSVLGRSTQTGKWPTGSYQSPVDPTDPTFVTESQPRYGRALSEDLGSANDSCKPSNLWELHKRSPLVPPAGSAPATSRYPPDRTSPPDQPHYGGHNTACCSSLRRAWLTVVTISSLSSDAAKALANMR